ncbi:MAG: hypothetical protein WBQ73_01430 [Candidatus Babeliales bacterium]
MNTKTLLYVLLLFGILQQHSYTHTYHANVCVKHDIAQDRSITYKYTYEFTKETCSASFISDDQTMRIDITVKEGKKASVTLKLHILNEDTNKFELINRMTFKARWGDAVNCTLHNLIQRKISFTVLCWRDI